MSVPNTPFDDSEEIVFKIRKAKFVGELDHWYGQLYVLGEEVCTCTALTFWGVFDDLSEYLIDSNSDIERKWLEEDVNENKRRKHGSN